MSLANNLTINGNRNTIQFNASTLASMWTICFNGLDYTTINDLVVDAVTKALTSCSNTASKFITVNPVPLVSIQTNNQSVCLGSSTNLFAVGANTYLWSNGFAGSGLSVSPLVSTTYSVSGTNNFGCSSTTSQLINITPLPVVAAVSVPP